MFSLLGDPRAIFALGININHCRMRNQMNHLTIIALIDAKNEIALLYSVFHPMLYSSENSANHNAKVDQENRYNLMKIRYLKYSKAFYRAKLF